jgi:zinc D-Ala-D-Ala dipeptidase
MYESFNKITKSISADDRVALNREQEHELEEFVKNLPGKPEDLESLLEETYAQINNLDLPEGSDARIRQKNFIILSFLNAKIRLIENKLKALRINSPEKVQKENENTAKYAVETETRLGNICDKALNILVVECNEKLCDLKDIPGIKLEDQEKEYLVREGVKKKLKEINETLNMVGLGLMIGDAWRSPKSQQILWKKEVEMIKQNNPGIQESQITAYAQIAPPELMAHTSGACVDAVLYDLETGEVLDFGVPPLAHQSKSQRTANYTNSPLISATAKKNRKLMVELFENAGFANLPTEFWHFSFGDKTWAAIKEKESAIYGELDNENI